MLMNKDIWRRIGANILILAQLIACFALARSGLDFVQPVLQLITASNLARIWLLTVSSQAFQQYGPAQFVLLSLLSLFVNGLCAVLLLTPGIPLLCVCIGLLSGIWVSLKSLWQTINMTTKRGEAKEVAKGENDTREVQVQKSFAFERGWQVEKLAAENLSVALYNLSYSWFGVADLLTDWGWMRNGLISYWLNLVKVGCWLAGLLQYVLAVELAGLCSYLCTTLLLLWDIGALLCIAALLCVQTVYRRLHRIFLHCPYCSKDISVPVYICPVCRAECARLQPGLYGILARPCSSCGARLPTLQVNGLKQLDRMCPHCRHALTHAIGAGTDIHIAIVGSAAAGKTNYIVQAVNGLTTTHAQWHSMLVTFSDLEQKERVQMLAQQLKRGSLPTTEPAAYILQLQERQRHIPYILYLHDSVGRTFLSAMNGCHQEYYSYLHGLLFMIDPLMLSSAPIYIQGLEEEGATQKPRLGELVLMQIYERLLQQIETARDLDRGRCYPLSVAVVLTKVDIAGVDNKIGLPALQKLLAEQPTIRTEAAAVRQLVSTFLREHGLEPLMRSMEAHFQQVEYFACSTYEPPLAGQGAQASHPFHVLHPLLWLLAHIKELKAGAEHAVRR